MSASLLIAASAGLALASARFIVWLVRDDDSARRAGYILTALATVIMLTAAGCELTAFVPHVLTAGPQVLLFITCALFLVFFMVARPKLDMPLAGPVVAPLGAAILLALGIKGLRVDVVAPGAAQALGSLNVVHIGATIVGFLLFLPAYVLSVLYLDQEYHLRHKQKAREHLPSLLRLEQLAWQLIYVGFPLYSIGLLMGLMWQEQLAAELAARPQHLLALASWMMYGYTIIRRLKTGWRGRRAAIVQMAAFVTTLSAVLLYTMR
jgi:ABC-type uncharacterized transport system permease subunit